MIFSERMGFAPTKPIQIDSIDHSLRIRLLNYFFDHGKTYETIKFILDKMGCDTGNPDSYYAKLRDKFLKSDQWYVPYDIYEYLFEYLVNVQNITLNELQDIIYEINQILSEEKSGYRMVNGKFVLITNETELEAIQSAMQTTFDPVDTHIKKSLDLFSDRKQPDYENSIKESISAVESMCCIITGLKGRQATLGTAIKKLKDNGIELHKSLEGAFNQLYGYASDQSGIRHGGIEFKKVSEEDARYMLVTCSAFVNYLKEKYTKLQKDD